MDSIQAVLRLVESGHLFIKDSGEIWKLGIRGKHCSFVSIEPKRAENRLKNGYLGVKVYLEGKQYMALAHRVVWTAMKGEIPKGMDLNHKDGNKTNNWPMNLDVVTRGENHRHAYSTGLRALSKNMPKPKLKEVALSAKKLRSKGLTYQQIATNLEISVTLAWRAVKS